MHMSFVKTLLECVVCSKCKSGKMIVKENAGKKMGLASSFTFECNVMLVQVAVRFTHHHAVKAQDHMKSIGV